MTNNRNAKAAKVAKSAKSAKVASKAKVNKVAKSAKVASKAKVNKVDADKAAARREMWAVGVEFSGGDKLVDIKPNPKREGAAAYDRYAAFERAAKKAKGGITVEAAIAAGFTRGDIKWGIGHGHFSLKRAK